MRLKYLLGIVLAFTLISADGQSGKFQFIVDTAITGFHFAINYSGTYIYTENGAVDIYTGKHPSAFSVTKSDTLSFKTCAGEVIKLSMMSEAQGYKIDNWSENDTTLEGHHMYYITYKESSEKQKYENIVFNAVCQMNNSVMIFTSGDLDKGKYFEAFKKTYYKLISDNDKIAP